MVPASTLKVLAVEIALTERLKLRRQMTAAAGKKSTTPLSFFMEAFGLEVEEEYGDPDMGRRGMDRKMVHGIKRSMAESDS